MQKRILDYIYGGGPGARDPGDTLRGDAWRFAIRELADAFPWEELLLFPVRALFRVRAQALNIPVVKRETIALNPEDISSRLRYACITRLARVPNP